MKNTWIYFIIAMIVLFGCQTKSGIDPVAAVERTQPAADTKVASEAQMGQMAFQQGNYLEAVQYFSQYLEKNPDDAEALFYRGRAALQLSQPDIALEDLTKAKATSEKKLSVSIYECKALINLNRLDEAQKIAEAILADPEFGRLNPYERYWAYYMDGQIKTSKGHFEKALVSLDQAIKTFDLNPAVFAKQKTPYVVRFALYHKSLANHNLGRQSAAAADMERYIELSKKAGAEVPSKDYKSLVLAYYLCENLAKCKEYLPNVSAEDKQDLSNRFQHDTIFD